MGRTLFSFDDALVMWQAILNDSTRFLEFYHPEHYMAQLALAHGIMHARPRNFFVPETYRLRRAYEGALDFLVGNGHSLVQLSNRLKWHKPAEPMQDQPKRGVCLTTPPELVSLLHNHPNTPAVTKMLFTAAYERKESAAQAERTQAEAKALLAANAESALLHIQQQGGETLLQAVYAALKRRYD